MQQVIPPFNPGLEYYDAPERDMAVLCGCGSERNRDGFAEEPRKRGKRRAREHTVEEDEGEDERPSSASTIPFAPHLRTQSFSDRPWSGPVEGIPIPPPPSSLPHRFSEPHLPPFRPQHQHAVPVQLSPNSELDVPVLQAYYPPLVMSMAPPTLPSSAQNPSPIVTPGSIQHVTPTSLVLSSPAVETDAMGMSQGAHDHESSGPISKGIISPGDARTLVDQYVLSPFPMGSLCSSAISFHEHLSPSLFGYHLEFGHFPYLPDGPRTMTPFILAVLSLVSSERLSPFVNLHGPLRNEVTSLLLTSPAGSWQDLSTAKTLDGGEDALDPELGIGPEEIVAACILATFWSDSPGDGVVIASHAFRWARGWIKVGR